VCRTLAAGGNVKAMVRLANAYRFGLGTPRDETAAQAWYQKAAAAGSEAAATYVQRQNITVPPTPKKLALKGEAGNVVDGVDFANLPLRPEGMPTWASLAAAQKNRAGLKALSGEAPTVQLIQARLGDGEGLKASAQAAGARDDLGRSPLMLAVAYNKPEAIAALLEGKPDLGATDKQGMTAAGLAAQACDSQKLEALAKAGDDLKGGASPPLVLAAASCEDWSNLKGLFAKVDFNAHDGRGRTAAFYAAATGNLSLLGWLADQGADLNLADTLGFSPLHSAAQHGQDKALRFIVTKTGKMPMDSKRQVTPLMLASNAGCLACIATLLDSRPDLDQKDADGDTALMFAVRSLQGVAVQKLVDSGANLNAKNNAGDTPLKLGVRLGLTQVKASN
jgi:ankyrin repeat protein